MSLLQALLLGIVQGATEFLPVSSTAHLVLVPWLLGWKFEEDPQFVFDVLVQVGTLVAVVAYFRRDVAAITREALAAAAARAPLRSPEARLGWWLLLGTVPVAAVGLAFHGFFEGLHRAPAVVAGILGGTALLLFAAERLGRRERGVATLTAGDALFVGTAQALALFPGVSRSAATIAGGLLRGLDRPAAARFSFLLSIPALLAAGTLAVVRLLRMEGWERHLPSLAAGFVAAAVIGYASIHWLLGYLSRRPLDAFAWYRLAAAAACLALWWGRGG